jgi:hypothetical protein
MKTDFFLNASKGQCFLQFLHSSRPGSTRFGASIGCWKRCFQGSEYKNSFVTSLRFCSINSKRPSLYKFLTEVKCALSLLSILRNLLNFCLYLLYLKYHFILQEKRIFIRMINCCRTCKNI